MKLFLIEGGNIIVFSGKKADRISYELKDKVKNQLLELFSILNKKFKKQYQKDLFPTSIEKVLSGSSKFLFSNQKIDKDSFGDIDVQINKNYEEEIKEFFPDNKEINFKDFIYLGRTNGNKQISTLWRFKKLNLNIQIDFEFVNFKNNEPEEFERFARSSDINDINNKIKGVFHKWLLASIDRAFPIEIYVSKKGKIEKIKTHEFAFSVTNGLRPKWKIKTKDNGEPETYRGEPVYIAISPNEVNFNRNIKEIGETLFRSKFTDEDVKKMWSFEGLVDLIKDKLNKTEQKRVLDAFENEFCFGEHSQQLYRDDKKRDKEEKTIAINFIKNKLNLK